MRKVQKIEELKQILGSIGKQDSSLGLVPTMGALHEGHYALLEQCKVENDFCVATIFVNPLQFNEKKDYETYPRREEEDLKALEERGCDLVFFPSREEIYPDPPAINIQFGDMERVLEGKHRPGHFQGVALVLTKFFNLIRPDRAYFGLKDLQQFLLVRWLVSDLSIDTVVVGVPTIREESGLALSSRNLRLSTTGKTVATKLSQGLISVEGRVREKHPPRDIVKGLREFYQQVSGLDIEYVEMVDARSLRSLHAYDGVKDLAICVAGYVEGVRLIDNLYLYLDSAE